MAKKRKKFNEPSKVLGLRVPVSQYANYKKQFESIINKTNGNVKYEYFDLLKLAIMEKNSFIMTVHNYIKRNGSISYKKFCNLHKSNVDMEIITQADLLLKAEVI